jgi:hypothetical protein
MEKSKGSTAPSYKLLQQRRRDEALSRQKHARTQQFNLARMVQGKVRDVLPMPKRCTL